MFLQTISHNYTYSYISFCEQIITPRKIITLYPNNEPWVTNSLKNILNQKRRAFYQGDAKQQKDAQKLVKEEIMLAKR